MAKQKIIGVQTMTKELRLEMIQYGMTVIEDLAEEIAKVANSKAPVIRGESQKDFPLRRGPDKAGKASSGPIKGSIFAQASEKVPYSWLVVSPAWYSHFPEYGTSPHTISPKRFKKTGQLVKSKALVFPVKSSNSKGVFGESGLAVASSVNHPGVRGKGKRAFLRPASDQAELILKRIISQLPKG